LGIITFCFNIGIHEVESFGVYLDGKDVYTCAISRIAAFIISSLNAQQFHKVEEILIGKLFRPQLYPALFAQDLLCLLARYLNLSEIKLIF
jgi:hypothetical protein